MKKNKRKIKLLVAVFVFCFLFSARDFSLAVNYYDEFGCDDKDGDAKKQCEYSAEKAEAYEKLIKLKEKQEESIENQLKSIDQEQAVVTVNLKDARAKYYTVKEEIEKLEKDIKEREKSMEYNRKILAGVMQSYFEYKQNVNSDLIVLDNRFAQVFNFGDQLDQSGDKMIELLNALAEDKKKMEEDKDVLDGKKEEYEKTKETLEEKNLNLQYTENKKQQLLGQTQADKKRYESLLASIEQEIDDLESGKSVDYSKLPPAKGGYFDYPVSSVRITQGYGKTSFSKNYVSGLHNGIDFGLSSGNNVFAARKGKVIGKGNNGKYAYGKWIAIDHGDGLVTLYGHLSSQSVSKGKKVDTGDKIGKSGNTGFSTGPHLHFSVFSAKSFEVVESKYVKGLMIPIGASINPNRYLK